MKGIPVKTGDFLKNAVREFPRTPYAGAKAIQNFLFHNYGYGCDENILQEKWTRYPNEIKKFMTCQDAGIFNYMMAKQLGLDVVLVKFDDFNETNQSHLGALVSGEDSHYLLSNTHFEKIILKENKYISIGRKVNAVKLLVNTLKKLSAEVKDIPAEDMPESSAEIKDTSTFSKASFLDIGDVVQLIESSRGKEGFLDFFATGQFTSTYYGKLKSREKRVYSVNRFLKINNNFMEIRRSFNFAGYITNLLFTEDKLKMIFSSGINNSILINPFDLFQADCSESNRNSVLYKDMLCIEQPEEIKTKIEDAWVRRRIALMLAEQFIKKKHKNLNNLVAVRGEDDFLNNKICPKNQMKLAYLHAVIGYCINGVQDESMQLYKEKFSGGKSSPYAYAYLMINDYVDAQVADSKSRFSKYHTSILTKAKDIGKEYGLSQ